MEHTRHGQNVGLEPNGGLANLAYLRPATPSHRNLQVVTDPLFVEKVRDVVGLYISPLEKATGHVLGRCHQRHRQQEFLKFLDLIDQTIPAEPGVEIHLVMDNDATYKAPRVKRWFAKRPRFQVPFSPTSAS